MKFASSLVVLSASLAAYGMPTPTDPRSPELGGPASPRAQPHAIPPFASALSGLGLGALPAPVGGASGLLSTADGLVGTVAGTVQGLPVLGGPTGPLATVGGLVSTVDGIASPIVVGVPVVGPKLSSASPAPHPLTPTGTLDGVTGIAAGVLGAKKGSKRQLQAPAAASGAASLADQLSALQAALQQVGYAITPTQATDAVSAAAPLANAAPAVVSQVASALPQTSATQQVTDTAGSTAGSTLDDSIAAAGAALQGSGPNPLRWLVPPFDQLPSIAQQIGMNPAPQASAR